MQCQGDNVVTDGLLDISSKWLIENPPFSPIPSFPPTVTGRKQSRRWPETRKIVRAASEFVNGENEVEDGGKSSAGTRDARERERERGGVREGRRAKRGGPDDELAEMTSRAKSLR